MRLQYIFGLLLFLFLNNLSWGQNIGIESILKLPEVETNNYTPNKDAQSLYLKMSYGSSFISTRLLTNLFH